MVFIHWMEIESFTITQMTRAVGLAETTVRRWAQACREVMAAEAWYRQGEIKIGGLDRNRTAEIEADETVLAHWEVNEEGGPARHYWWIWLGVEQRGWGLRHLVEGHGGAVVSGR